MKTKKCGKGKIMRKAYTTKKGTKVKAACVKDMGKPGKGKKLFTLKKGGLSEYGYSVKLGRTERRKALEKARKKIEYATLIQKLNALAILFKNTKPQFSKRLRADISYLQRTK